MQNSTVDPPLSFENWLQQARNAKIATYSEFDIEQVRGVWDRNQDQVCTIRAYIISIESTIINFTSFLF